MRMLSVPSGALTPVAIRPVPSIGRSADVPTSGKKKEEGDGGGKKKPDFRTVLADELAKSGTSPTPPPAPSNPTPATGGPDILDIPPALLPQPSVADLAAAKQERGRLVYGGKALPAGPPAAPTPTPDPPPLKDGPPGTNLDITG